MPPTPPFHSSRPWNRTRPKALVVACSDGRLQQNLDEFLQKHLAITQYDRLFAPGGPGAMASSGIEFLRGDSFRRECLFLVEAHRVEDVYLIFHGPGEDGPDEAVCADYRRLFPRADAATIRAQQHRDLQEIVSGGFGWQRRVRVHGWACEVGAGDAIRFVSLHTPQDAYEASLA